MSSEDVARELQAVAARSVGEKKVTLDGVPMTWAEFRHAEECIKTNREKVLRKLSEGVYKTLTRLQE